MVFRLIGRVVHKVANGFRNEIPYIKKDPGNVLVPASLIAGVHVLMFAFGGHKLLHGWDVARHHEQFPYENIHDADETKLGAKFWKRVHRHEVFQGLNERMSHVDEDRI
jgi:hypothetical protein